MRVRLTRNRLHRLIDIVPSNVAEELQIEHEYHGTYEVTVRAAYIAWEMAQQALVDELFNPRGGVRKDANRSLVGALRAITRSKNAYDRHPALRGAAVLGHPTPVTFPVWELPEPEPNGMIYSPIPTVGCRFLVLRPHLLTEPGRRVTVWDEQGIAPSHDRLADEQVHQAFIGDW